MTFTDLGIIDPILKALEAKGYTHPTPIQEQSIPTLLEGKDLLGCAQTGTGKTAAFAIPILQQIWEDRNNSNRPRKVRALIVTPTRELAIQIGDSFSDYGKYTGIRNTVIFGGVKQGNQVRALKNGVDILVATPGRLLDLINQGFISLSDVQYSVLDEADHMLDMGFIHDIRKIVALLPEKRQSLFFSATMPPDIVKLSKRILGDPAKVTVKPQQATAERVEQAVYFVAKKDKVNLLYHILEEKNYFTVLVFSRTKHGADKIVRKLSKINIKAAAIHGNKSQSARQRALNSFKDGDLHVLVATDIAARGIDVDDLELVINYDLPNVPETYVHRIGRTGRASASGIAISFCDVEERAYLKDIQKLIRQDIPIVEEHPYEDDAKTPAPAKPAKNNNNNRRRPNHRNGNKNQSRNRSNNKNRRRKNTSRQD
ncbi:MAG: DEAD/DEAH box helicase [Bacteroidetes bacterium]|nr:DEAD/DEAH box helicase [Bacteroidota bacterium]